MAPVGGQRVLAATAIALGCPRPDRRDVSKPRKLRAFVRSVRKVRCFASEAKDVALTENGPRFQMRCRRADMRAPAARRVLQALSRGAWDDRHEGRRGSCGDLCRTISSEAAQVEWVLRPYFNRQKEALALPEDGKNAFLWTWDDLGVSSLPVRRSQRPERGSTAPPTRRLTRNAARPDMRSSRQRDVRAKQWFGSFSPQSQPSPPANLLACPDVGDPWPESGPSCWGTWRGEET